MHLLVGKLSGRARAAFVALTITWVAVGPAVLEAANATDLPPAPLSCAGAKAVWQQSVHQQQVARATALAAAKAVAKSRARHQSAIRQQTLKNIQVAASKKYRAKVASAKI